MQLFNCSAKYATSKNTDLLVRVYITYVRLFFEYNSVIWSPHLKRDVNAVEKMCRDAKRISGLENYS